MISLVLATMALLASDDSPGPAPWWGPEVEASIARAPGRREAWEAMLRGTKPEHREGVAYLMTDLPLRDLETLAPEALAANVDLAYRVRDEVAWGRALPEPIFLDAVLPHASLTERRDPMRAEFHDRYLPLVRDCKTPGEAALKLNAALFRDYKVVYNTRRLRTDQASRESIAQGMATCTGLSIMLVEAARAVGIPARVAGIRSWPGRGGNHTWAEVWDDGWHFVGAAEPDPSGLDHAWFAGEAGSAVADEPRNAIWAATYRRTGSYFPLAWDSRARVNAENVTARYAKKAPAPAGPRLMVEVIDDGERVEAEVKAFALDSGDVRLEGTSLGPRADINRHLSAPSSPGERVLVAVQHRDRRAARFATVEGDTVVRVDLDRPIDDDRGPLVALLADRFGEDDAKARTRPHAPAPRALRRGPSRGRLDRLQVVPPAPGVARGVDRQDRQDPRSHQPVPLAIGGRRVGEVAGPGHRDAWRRRAPRPGSTIGNGVGCSSATTATIPRRATTSISPSAPRTTSGTASTTTPSPRSSNG